MTDNIKKLEKYGKVEKCEITDQKLHIIITDGFSTQAVKTLALLEEVSTMSQFDKMIKCITDHNYCEIVLIN